MKKWFASFSFLAVLTLAACGGGGSDDSDESTTSTNDSSSFDADAAEEIFNQSCVSCHGQDMTGGTGPDLTKVGDELSEDEIHDIVENGKDGMPGGLVQDDADLDNLVKWLASHK